MRGLFFGLQAFSALRWATGEPFSDWMCCNFDIVLGPILTPFPALCHAHKRRVTSLPVQSDRLIGCQLETGACTPTVCPIRCFRLELVSWTGLTLAMLLAANPARSAAVPAALWVLYLSIVRQRRHHFRPFSSRNSQLYAITPAPWNVLNYAIVLIRC